MICISFAVIFCCRVSLALLVRVSFVTGADGDGIVLPFPIFKLKFNFTFLSRVKSPRIFGTCAMVCVMGDARCATGSDVGNN